MLHLQNLQLTSGFLAKKVDLKFIVMGFEEEQFQTRNYLSSNGFLKGKYDD